MEYQKSNLYKVHLKFQYNRLTGYYHVPAANLTEAVEIAEDIFKQENRLNEKADEIIECVHKSMIGTVHIPVTGPTEVKAFAEII
jgi:hypothetical protein